MKFESFKDQTALTVVLSLISALTILFNGLVIAALIGNKSLRAVRSNAYILCLAVTDIGVGLITMPFNIDYHRSKGHTWDYGEAACITWLLNDLFLCTASMWLIAAIAADRLVVSLTFS